MNVLGIEHYFYHKRESGERRWSWHFKSGRVISAELSFRSYSGLLAEVRTHGGDGDDALSFVFALPKLVFAHLEIERVFKGDGPAREYGLSVYSDTVAFAWGYTEDDYYYPDAKQGWRKSVVPIDLLLGRTTFSKEPLRTIRVLVPLPEGNYPTTLTFKRHVWKRPRWPWAQSGFYVDIEPDKPFPVEGKGENSWDIGEDAIYSMHRPGKTASEAISAAVESVLRDRQKHGIPDSVEHTGGFLLGVSE